MGRVADTSGYTQNELELWQRITEVQDTVFYTAKGLPFKINVTGNELFVDRRKKSITRASVDMAYKKWLQDKDCGPKALGVFGASYLWSVFRVVENKHNEVGG